MTLPSNLAGGLQRYIQSGMRPGSFLSAVLENDLLSAVQCADACSLQNLKAIVEEVWSVTPDEAWGSEAKVTAWIRARGAWGIENDRMEALRRHPDDERYEGVTG